MDPFTMAMIGAAIGGMTSKKPLKGAIIGGLGGYAGATAMPGLLGTAPAAATVGATEAAAATVAPTVAAQAATPAVSSASATALPETGLLADLKAYGSVASDKLKAANETFKPVGQAMSSAQLVASMFPPSAPVETPAPQFGGGGNPVFNAMDQQQQAMDAQRMQEEMQRRQAQQKLLSMIGGR